MLYFGLNLSEISAVPVQLARKKSNGKLSSSQVAAALLFFVLAPHALLVGTAHTHLAPGSFDYAPDRAAKAGGVGVRQDAPESKKGAGHAQCLLCRLQRDLSSGLRHDVPRAAAPHARPFSLESQIEPVARSADLKYAAGRGPPPASSAN